MGLRTFFHPLLVVMFAGNELLVPVSGCNSLCGVCTAGTCTSCVTGASAVSVSDCACASGFYLNGSSCISCDGSCKECAAGGATDCTVCFSGFSLFVAAPGSCASCHVSCHSCSDATASGCADCYANAVLAGSLPSTCACLPGFFPAPTPGSCSLCSSLCNTCQGPLSTQCANCKPGAHLSGGTAPDSCVCNASFFPDPDASKCSSCDPSCATCIRASECTTCVAPSFVSRTSLLCVCGQRYYQDPSPLHCSSCHATCFSCSGPADTQCTACWPYAHLSGGACVCDSAFFPSTSTAECRACHSTCATCLDSSLSSCLSCLSNAHLTTVCLCNDGYYFVLSPVGCVACDQTCMKCLGAPACTACFPNAKLVGTVCVCVDGFYPNSDSSLCAACDPSCKDCTGPSLSDCTLCFDTAQLATGTCLCFDGFYPSPHAGNCQPCNPVCIRCTGPSSADCLECSKISSGLCAIDGTGSAPCLACDHTCATCDGVGASQCVTCKSNAGLLNTAPSSCICSYGYFPNLSSAACSACHPTCKRCFSVLSTDCYLCYNYSVLLHSLIPSSCVCVAGYFLDLTSKCSVCAAECRECSGAASTQCVVCFEHAATVSSPGSCVCTQGFFGTPTNCQPCHFTCLECSAGGMLDCTFCFINATKQTTGECLCDPHYYPNTAQNNCSPCHSTCSACFSATEFSCVACYANALLSSDPVLSSCICEVGFYPDTTSANCKACHSSCRACDGGTSLQCTSCFQHAALAGSSPNACVCAPWYFPNPSVSACAACHPTCKSCDASVDSRCTDCFSSAALEFAPAPSRCVCVAPAVPLPTTAQCGLCDSSCLSCDALGPAHCTTCFPRAHKLNPSDYCFCDTGTFTLTDASKCTLCDVTCKDCSGLSPTSCVACFAGAQLEGPAPARCVCPSGFFPSPNSINCLSCFGTCLQCTGPKAADCTTCAPGSVHNSSGVCVCASGFFPKLTATNCVPCHPSCKECSEASIADCLSCMPGALLTGPLPSTCRCLPGTFPDTPPCTPCSSSCKACSSATQNGCLSCYAHAKLIGSAPSECWCSDSFYPQPDSSNCLPCPSSCLTCVSPNVCLSCLPNSHLMESQCKCADGFFSSVSGCESCPIDCVFCDSVQCFQCRNGLTLLNGECKQVCKSDCTSLTRPAPVPSLFVSQNNTLYIEFDRAMNCSLTAADVSVRVGDGLQVVWSDLLAVDNRTFALTLYFVTSLAAGTPVVLTFLHPAQVTDALGVAISLTSLSGVLNAFSSNTAFGDSAIASQARSASRGGLALSLAASVALSSPFSFLAFIGRLQLVTYLAMSEIQLSEDFASVLAGLNVVRLFSGEWNEVPGSKGNPPYFVQKYGIRTSLCLWNLLVFAGCCALVLLAYVPIALLSRVKSQRIATTFSSLLPSLRWSTPLTLWFAFYLDFGVFALLQLVNTEVAPATTYEQISFAAASVVSSAFVLTPLCFGLFYWRKQPLIRARTDASFNRRWGVLFLQFRSGHASLSVHCMFFFRRIVLAFSLLLIPSSIVPLAALNCFIALLVTSTQAFAHASLFRLYENKLDQFEVFLQEGGTTLIYLLVGMCSLDFSENARGQLGLAGVVTVVCTMGSIILMSAFRAILKLVALVRTHRRKLSKVHPRYEGGVEASTTRTEMSEIKGSEVKPLA